MTRRLVFILTGATLIGSVAGFARAEAWPARAGGSAAEQSCSAQEQTALPAEELIAQVAPASASEAWAAGTFWRDYTQPNDALVYHWDGQTWSRTLLPMRNVQLVGVAAWSPSRAWLIGWNGVNGAAAGARWTGRSWQVLPMPNRPASNHRLEQLVAVSAAEAWAVGALEIGVLPRVGRPSVLHWQGRSWKRETLPARIAKREIALYSVDASSPRNVWTVGTDSRSLKAVALRFTGSGWQEVRLPAPRYLRSVLERVFVRSKTRVFVFGFTDTNPDRGENGHRAPYAFTWDGRTWRPYNTHGLSVRAPARGGGYWAASKTAVFRLHDDGRTKRVLTIPWADESDARLDDLVESPSGELWVTGSFYDTTSETSRAVIARYRCR